MTLTGQTFDLDPKTFTLSNMFSMQLHKFKEDIAKVTSCALKELTIENEIKKLADTWQEQRFDLHKYHSVSVCGRVGASNLGAASASMSQLGSLLMHS
jgi:hypothetical protein